MQPSRARHTSRPESRTPEGSACVLGHHREQLLGVELALLLTDATDAVEVADGCRTSRRYRAQRRITEHDVRRNALLSRLGSAPGSESFEESVVLSRELGRRGARSAR